MEKIKPLVHAGSISNECLAVGASRRINPADCMQVDEEFIMKYTLQHGLFSASFDREPQTLYAASSDTAN